MASPTASSSISPPTGVKKSSPWTPHEETELVQTVQMFGENEWELVKEHLVANGHPDRGRQGVERHYEMLRTRAEARAETLTGPVCLEPWTVQEDATLLALLEVHRDPSVGKKHKIKWRRYRSLLPGRGALDLAQRLGNLQQLLSRTSRDPERMKAVRAKKIDLLDAVKKLSPHVKSSARPSASSASSNASNPTPPLPPTPPAARNLPAIPLPSRFCYDLPPSSSNNAVHSAASSRAAPSNVPHRVASIAIQPEPFPSSSAPSSSPAAQQHNLTASSTDGGLCDDPSAARACERGESNRLKRIRAIFDEGRKVLKRVRETFEAVEAEGEE